MKFIAEVKRVLKPEGKVATINWEKMKMRPPS
ncbi:MAG: hypothetical protein HPY74_02410 [Firmicutes bacterium]|nr:hypothetical protein [Bacillota bacterium]